MRRHQPPSQPCRGAATRFVGPTNGVMGASLPFPDVLRAALAAALLILLSGCLAAPAPPGTMHEAAAPDEGMTVTATRVEPLVHEVDAYGRIQARPCGVGEVRTSGDRCNGGSAVAAGIAWEVPIRDYADPAALFWRVTLAAPWQSASLVDALRMTVFTTTPCGLACVELRKVAETESPTSPGFERLDIYLQEGETGLRVQLEPVGYTETTWTEAAVHYHLFGAIGGYRPVAAPVVIG